MDIIKYSAQGNTLITPFENAMFFSVPHQMPSKAPWCGKYLNIYLTRRNMT